MGGRMRAETEKDPRDYISKGGEIIHEVGGAIMGSDPKKSVTNPWGQLWDAKNVFLTDGAPFCSNADKNPTLTIMALAWRSADHMLDLMRKGEV
jgi:choline dehydrogenase-like flavoprotein